MTKLHSFQVVLPRTRVPQEEALEWQWGRLCHYNPDPEGRRKKFFLRYAVGPGRIEQRYSDLPDIVPELQAESIYPAEGPPSPMETRMRAFQKRSTEVFREIYAQETQPPDQLLHITCTGYASPSAPQLYAVERGWSYGITHAYHMGCYAALPALRLADALLAGKKAQRVDLVHNEICSLHMDLRTQAPEQYVVQTLFADGHVKYSASLEASGPSLEVLGIKELLIPGTQDLMTWVPASWGMAMTLSRDVPEQVRAQVRGFVAALCAELGVDVGLVLREGVFAIHPGGPRIIEAVQEQLELSDAQVAASSAVLRERGNLSSATLPHIWERLLRTEPLAGRYVLSLAFGPGLTIFGALLRGGGT